MNKQELLERIEDVMDKATGQYPDIMGLLDDIRHDLEDDIVEENHQYSGMERRS